MKIWAQALLLMFLAVWSCAGTIGPGATVDTGQCPDQDVWVYIKHSDSYVEHPTCLVVVHIPKHTLIGDFENCPSQDTKVVGRGRTGYTKYAGVHIVTLKKGTLNDPKNYTTKPPNRIETPANNINTWHADR